jgi:hypothetical protein
MHFEVFSNSDKKVVAFLQSGGFELNKDIATDHKLLIATVDKTRIEPYLIALVFAIVKKFRVNDETWATALALNTIWKAI